MSHKPLGVGIVGVQPGRSWATLSHIPALAALPDRFRIAGIANTSRASAEAAVAATGLATAAFDDVAALVASPEVDVVTVAVKVPAHLAIVRAAIDAGKHVYCEWPLGNGLAEAAELADLAKARGVVAVVGTQARLAPEIRLMQKLVAEGYVGRVLSTTMVAQGGPRPGGASIPDARTYGYMMDRANGANLLTIPLGHSLSALTEVLGAPTALSATLAVRRPTVMAEDSGETLAVTSPDQVLVAGVIGDVPVSLHFRGGAARGGDGLVWEVNGTEGDLRLTGPSGHPQMTRLVLEGVREGEAGLTRLEMPADLVGDLPASVAGDPRAANVARVYAAMGDDIRSGTRTAPDFDAAVALHRIIDAIERSDAEGRRVPV